VEWVTRLRAYRYLFRFAKAVGRAMRAVASDAPTSSRSSCTRKRPRTKRPLTSSQLQKCGKNRISVSVLVNSNYFSRRLSIWVATPARVTQYSVSRRRHTRLLDLPSSAAATNRFVGAQIRNGVEPLHRAVIGKEKCPSSRDLCEEDARQETLNRAPFQGAEDVRHGPASVHPESLR